MGVWYPRVEWVGNDYFLEDGRMLAANPPAVILTPEIKSCLQIEFRIC